MALHAAAAQVPVAVLHGHVRGASGGAPVSGAVVRLVLGRMQVATALDGGFALDATRGDDTLVVTAIGYLPDSTAVAGIRGDSVTVLLRPAPIGLSELVGWSSASLPLASGQAQAWSVSGRAITALPSVIEPDVSRALALVPGVSFSSLLSARPMLRGLGADNVVTAIDGFTAINLYHAGRLFSSIPAVAVDHVDVQFQPAGADLGRATAGEVNITGKASPSPGGAELQIGEGASSAAAGVASPGGNASLLIAARTARTSVIDQQLAENDLKYDFGDFYAKAHATLGGAPTQLSVFSSSDHLAPDITDKFDSAYSGWSNLVVGVRSDLVHRSNGGVVAALSYAHHVEDAHGVASRGIALDVRNRFASITGQLDGQRRLSPGSLLRFGFIATGHDIQNDVAPVSPAGGVLVADLHARPVESAAYAEVDVGTERTRAIAGVRVDHSGGVTAVQPRLSLRLARSRSGWFEVAVGRSVRLFDLITDGHSESEVAYSYWLPGGTGGTPLAAVTSASLAMARSVGDWQLRADLFGSTGDGDADLKPFLLASDAGQIFRFGETRAYGAALSAVASASDGRWSVLLSYTYAMSERNWGAGWVPWTNDRRHEGRAFGTWRALRGVQLSTSVEVASPLPYTPIGAWVVVPAPQAFDQLRPIYGTEMSGRGTALLRIDAALLKHFTGPGHSRWDAGIGISNLSWGDQSARTQSLDVPAFGLPTLNVRTAFAFRAIPSVMLRGEIGAFR